MSLSSNELSIKKITLLYLAFGMLWILLSDRIAALLISDSMILTWVQTTNGWLFVLVTAFGLFLLLRGRENRIAEQKNMALMIQEAERRLRFIQRFSHTGGWELDLTDQTSRRTLEHDLIFGYESLLPEWSYDMFLEHVLAEDRGEVDRKFRESIETETDWNFECRIRRVDGAIRWIWATGCHQRSPDEQTRSMAGIVQDITDRKKVEEDLLRNEQIVSSSKDMLALLDRQYIYRLINPAYLDAFGFSPDQVMGHTVTEVFGEDIFNSVIRSHAEKCLMGKTVNHQDWIDFPELGKRYLDIHYYPYRDSGGEVQGVVVNARDETQRKLSEESLEQSRNTLTEAQKIAHLGSFEYIAATRTTLWSEEEYHIYGLDPAAPSPEYDVMLERCIHPDDSDMLHAVFSKAMESNAVYELEHRILRPDGEVRWVFDRAYPYFNEAGELIRYVGVTLDITDRKQAGEELERSQKLMNDVLDAIPDIIWLKDDNGVYEMCNLEFTKLVNSHKEKILGATDYELFPLEKADSYRKHDRKAIENGRTTINEESAEYVHQDYSVWIETSKSPVYGSQGELVGVLGIGREITRRKQALQDSKEEQEFLNLIQDSSPIPMWIGSSNGTLLRANQALYNALNLTAEQLVGKYNLLEDDNLKRPGVAKKIDQIMQDKQSVRFDLLWKTDLAGSVDLSSGRDRYVDVSIFPLMNPEGELTNIVVQWVDITERKQAEEKLLLSESQLKEAQQVAHLGNWAQDVATDHITWSDENYRIFGIDIRESGLMFDEFLELVHPDDRDSIYKLAETLTNEGTAYFEYRLIRPDGEVRWVSGQGKTTYDEAGKPVRMFGVMQDCTERKQAEKELIKREELLHEMGRIARIGAWEFDITTGEGSWTDEVANIHDISPEEAISRDIGIGFFHGENRVAIEAAIQRAIDTAIPYDIELELVTAKGRHKWVRTIGHPVSEDGRVVMLRGAMQDISEIHKAKKALELSERRMRAVFDQQFQFTAILEADGTTIDINDLPLQAQGASRSDYVGKPFWKAPAWKELPDWQETIRQRMATIVDTEEILQTQDIYHGADGSLREAACITKAIRDESGQVEFILVEARDNTDQRQAERERDRLLSDLQVLNEQLELRVLERTSELVAANQELESFAYTVSHDLRAPVRAISGFESALREDYGDCLPAEGAEFLDEIQIGAQRMNVLIDGLLQLSRSTRGKLEMSNVDLGQITSDITRLYQDNNHNEGMQVQFLGGLLVKGYDRLLRTLMQNLLENAWKYRKPDTACEVVVDGSFLDGMACVCIQDNGIGFDPDFSHKLFEPFQRLHRQDEVPGIGIGLATCVRIIHRHGGDIAGCSRPGQGARFCFTLPVSDGERGD